MKSVLRAACPHCESVFVLSEAQMDAREGLVRCGACRRIFNAKWHLVDRAVGGAGNGGLGATAHSPPARQPPDEDAERSEESARDAPPGPGGEPVLGVAAESAESAEFAESADDQSQAVHDDPGRYRHRIEPGFDSPAEPDQAPPEPARQTDDPAMPGDPAPPPGTRVDMNGVRHYLENRPNPLVNLLWSAVALAFLMLLGGQVKYFFVDRYAQHPLLRPYLAGFCEIAACQLPPRLDPQRFTLTRTHIDLHPLQPGAIRVTVKLVNQAAFAQPYPRLRLTLTDRHGRVVGRRTFSPGQYLNRGRPNLLRSGELGAVFLDLARPHEKAVGFEIDVVGAPASS